MSRLPAPLAFLAELQAEIKNFVHPGFEATSPVELAAKVPFDGADYRADGHSLLVFGKVRDGSLYACWRRPGTEPDAGAVVFVGGDGQGNAVLALDARSFVEELLEGTTWMAMGQFSGCFYKSSRTVPGHATLVSTARERLGLETGRPADEIQKAAKVLQPEFKALLTKFYGW